MGCTFGKTGIGCIRGIKLLIELTTMLDPSKVKVLNEDCPSIGEIISLGSEAVDLSKKLHRAMLQLKGKYLQDDGKVLYASMRESPDYEKFKSETGRLKLVELQVLNETERKAFFINMYNTLTIHALASVVNEETTVLQLEKFWQMYAYKIGDLVFSLDDIEHGILRCNKLHPTYKQYFFKEGDPRRNFVFQDLDPRIHFALNCGAKSCPTIRLFSAENLDNAMDLAAKNFCQNDITINVQRKKVTASKILMWYGPDFGENNKAVMERLKPFLSQDQVSSYEEILSDFKIEYAEYDWSIH